MYQHRLTPSRGLTCCVGGPALIYYVSPTEEELFLRYNPELQKRSLENRIQKQEDFDNFVARLKEYSKSDKPSRYFVSYLLLLGLIEAGDERRDEGGDLGGGEGLEPWLWTTNTRKLLRDCTQIIRDSKKKHANSPSYSLGRSRRSRPKEP